MKESKVRKLSKTLAMMGLLSPVGANALGVGEIKLHSALNQYLEADIPLLTTGSEASSAISVKIASPSAFAKAGLDRPYYLTGLRFNPVVTGDSVVVKVTSREVIREPFLSFLVEVSWPQGRMFREFTVLLDPPATFEQKTVNAYSAPMVKSETVTRSPYPVDSSSSYGFRPAPSVPKQGANRQYKGGDFITSKRNDTL